MLSRIRLQRFKKFEDIEVQLRPFTILMGENSSGKTTVLQAIYFALHNLYYRGLIENKKGIFQARDRGVVLEREGLPGINISEVRDLFYGRILTNKDSANGAAIELVDADDNTYRLQVISLFGSFNIKCTSTKDDLVHDPKLHTLPPLLNSGFVGLRPSEERLYPRAIRNRLESGRVSEIIRNIVLDVRDHKKEEFEEFKNVLSEKFDFHLNEVSFDPQNDEHVKANFTDIDKNVSLDFNSSGSGFMQVLQILASIYRFAPNEVAVVLLDEPDAHLHPNMQSALVTVLRDIQKKLGIQIIISTHSSTIIQSADPSEIIPITTKTKQITPLFSKKDVDDEILRRLDAYHIAKAKISGKLVFIEDSNTQILEKFDEMLGTKCFQGVNTVPFITGNGRDNKAPFIAKDVLKRYIGEDVEIHFVIDGDGMSEHWRKIIADYALSNRVILHQLSRHDIESYLLNPELFIRVLKDVHPNKEIPDLEDIKDAMLQIMKNTVSLSRYKFDRKLEGHIYKSAMLVGFSEYRNPQKSESEAIKIREVYEKFLEFDQLIKVAIGKKTLSAVLDWLCSEKKLNIAYDDLLRNIKSDDVPEEIKSILEQLLPKS